MPLPVRISVDGSSYPLDKTKTVLENLEAQNIVAEFQCREGYCGACRVTKISGEVTYEQQPMAFLRKDEILPCYCKAVTDISIIT